MLYPSIDSLLAKIDSKYSLVSVAAKRARQLLASGNHSTLENPQSFKNVGIALEEIHNDKLTFEVEKD